VPRLNTFGFERRAGEIVRMAYAVREIRAAIDRRAWLGWTKDPIRRFGV
jgi:hypothetical protein